MTPIRPPLRECAVDHRSRARHRNLRRVVGLAPILFSGTALMIGVPCGLSDARAQEAVAGSGQPTSLFLRGTTGSGEQEAVFTQPVSSAADAEPADNEEVLTSDGRDTSDPVRQLQGRARPVQPEPPVVDPLVTDNPSARSNVRVAASQQGTGALPEDDPFAPTGFRIGTWRVFTSIAQFLGYSSNVNSVAMGNGGGYSQTDATLSVQSDWSRHSARIDASGNYRKFLNSDSPDLPSADVQAGLTLDLVDGVTADAGISYNYSTESATSTNISDSTVNRPGVHATGASLALARSGNRLSYSIRGSVGRTDYEALELDSGALQSQGDRNNTLYTAVGRVGYQATPALAPYIEGEIGRRIHDLKTDRNGEQRDSTITGVSVGTEVDISEKLTGNAAVGYKVERFDDKSIEDLGGLTLNGSIVWSPQRETRLTFNAQTSFSGSTTAGQNGSVINDFSVVAERKVNDRLTLNADASLSINDQDDGSRTDQVLTVGGGFNYWINRFMAFTGRVEHTNQQSTAGPPEEFDATTIQGGIRFQR